jgi:large subunit ribosomal protein L22
MAETTAEYRAEMRFVRVSPQKARLVLDLIKGRRVEDAQNTLTFTKKRIAEKVLKLLNSAIANANHARDEKDVDIDVDNLFVKRAVANDGPRMKRIRPAPQGRAYHYQRRLTHIEIALAEKVRANGGAKTEATAEAKPVAKKKVVAKKAPAKKVAAKKPAKKK